MTADVRYVERSGRINAPGPLPSLEGIKPRVPALPFSFPVGRKFENDAYRFYCPERDPSHLDVYLFEMRE